MKIKFITVVLSLGIMATLSFGHGMNNQEEQMKQSGNHMMNQNMPQQKQSGNHMMNQNMPQQNQSGNHMMNQSNDDDSGMMMKKSGNKPSQMSCGAGKCAAGKCAAGK